MAVTLTTSARDTACDSIVDLIDTAGTGKLDFYTDGFGTLLAELVFGATAFGASSTGTATANAITAETSAVATGTAGAFRIMGGNDEVVMSGSVSASGGDINLNTTSIFQGDSLSISSLTVTVPAS